MILDDGRLTVQLIAKCVSISSNFMHIVLIEMLGDDQAVFKIGPSYADAGTHAEKGWHFQDTSDSLPNKSKRFHCRGGNQDEALVHYFKPESNIKNKLRKTFVLNPRKSSRRQHLVGNVIASFFAVWGL